MQACQSLVCACVHVCARVHVCTRVGVQNGEGRRGWQKRLTTMVTGTMKVFSWIHTSTVFQSYLQEEGQKTGSV